MTAFHTPSPRGSRIWTDREFHDRNGTDRNFRIMHRNSQQSVIRTRCRLNIR